MKKSVRLNGKDGKEKEVCVDTAVQEKNITFPTDNKLYSRTIKQQKHGQKAERKIKTIAGRLVRELERKTIMTVIRCNQRLNNTNAFMKTNHVKQLEKRK
ncbi:MAG: hypothetical protein QME58_07245 [Bacteroidota bacterium]|nr:hypothetical protein [Bacteroidota bacterium]